MNLERTAMEFDEIHSLVEESIRKAGERMPADRQDLNRTPEDDIVDDLLSLLILAYTRGNRDANEMLSADIAVNTDRMMDAIYHRIDDKTFEDRARTHIRNEDPGMLIDLVESEYHRVYSAGGFETATDYDGTVTKTWVTMLDNRVRPTHDYLEGMTAPLGGRFFTFDGDSARYPGDFDFAENNVNCRCVLMYSAIT